ncbi:LysE family translocator [Rhizobium sp. KVB221]|uniref:LysE family translocator n=1 Tax=Rhizobium setariae TaxID=2801340 RepID=A0A937CP29_9HYPH|nr:LysE family translocator [Rhizobium setariae]MBL0374436.1 LysE family translocator [Rhizobium setariae]
MEYTQNLWLFAILLFGIIVVPGMDMLFVLTNALTGGKQAGFAAVGGIMLGGAVHTLTGTLGVGVLSFVIPWLRNPLILAGALYMMWIGWTLVRSAITVDGVGVAKARPASAIFRQGLVVCLLNPKAYLFIMAVFPQFMKPAFGPLWPQAIAMGLMTVLMQLFVYGSIAGAAARSRDFLLANPSATIWTGRIAGALLIAAAIWTAWQGLAVAG